MTWFTTHLALESLFIWMLIGTKLRKTYLESKRTRLLFFITSLSAIGPDLDYLIRLITGWIPGSENILNIFYHRGATHSIFFPLILVLIGMSVIFVNYYKNEFHSKNDTINLTKLIGYSFILASLFWIMHLILDVDSAEGGMLLFWPFDDGVYQPKIFIEMLAYPFLLLPWTPKELKIDVDFSNLQSLQVYLLNWTPDQIISYFGRPEFDLLLIGLILHSIIFLLYINYVIKPLLSGFKIHWPKNIINLFSNINNIWRQIPKWLLGSSLILILIGFSLGSMLGSELTDSRTNTSTLQFTDNLFSHSSKIVFESTNQPLDPNSLNEIHLIFNSIYVVNVSLALIFAPQYRITEWESQVSILFGQTENRSNIVNSTDLEFKTSYKQLVNDLISDPSVLFNKTDINEVFQPPIILTTGKQSISSAFILYDWNSATYWNQTNVFANINYSVNVIFHRNVNFLIGVFLQTIGIIMLISSLILAMKENMLKFNQNLIKKMRNKE